MQNNVCKIVFEQVQRRPGALAVVDADSWLTYADLAQRVGLVAAYLAAAGVAQGQRVISGMRSGPKELVTLLAIASLGALSVPLHPGWSNSRRAKVARAVPADWLILEGEEEELAQAKPVSIMLPPRLDEIDLPPAEPADVPVGSPFRAVFLAGAAGQRRTLELTHGNVLERLDLDPAHHGKTDRVGLLSLYDYTSLYTALRTLRAGATLGFLSHGNPLESIDVIGVTQLSIAAEAARLLQKGMQMHIEQGRFPTLELVELHSDMPEPLLLKQLHEAFAAPVAYRFGTVEHGVLARASPAEVQKRPACSGRVAEAAEIRITDEQGALQARGTVGCIQVRLQKSAYSGVQGREVAGTDGWLATRYYGRLDTADSLWILGRPRNLARIDGVWVNPALIEQVLKLHAGVNDAIVTVVPAPQGPGGKLVAGVDANELNAGELFRHCRELLPGPVPASVISISGLPFRSRRQFLAHISRMAG